MRKLALVPGDGARIGAPPAVMVGETLESRHYGAMVETGQDCCPQDTRTRTPRAPHEMRHRWIITWPSRSLLDREAIGAQSQARPPSTSTACARSLAPHTKEVKAQRIITIGASSGGVPALQSIIQGLPRDLPAAVCVVVHIAPDSPGMMPRLISKGSTLRAKHAVDGEELAPGHIYVAPPDQHLLIEPSGQMRLARGPRENRFRPAVDPLFRSAAHAYGPRVVGVVLSGVLDDGTAGLWAVKDRGGVAIVQDPKEAIVPSMPLSALRHVEVDHCAPAFEIGPLLARLAADRITTSSEPEGRPMDVESRILLGEVGPGEESWALGRPSSYACPECHGMLQSITEGKRVRFRCHVGHAYSADSLLSELTLEVGELLWSTQRAIEESAKLLQQEAERARKDGDAVLSEGYARKMKEAQDNATAVRALAMRQDQLSREKVEAEE
jgi:two-component system chemotaxis response regulator CheB